jgi:hypothetical protein
VYKKGKKAVFELLSAKDMDYKFSKRDIYLELSFVLNLKTAELSQLCENILITIKKLHILNSHLNLSLFQKLDFCDEYEAVIELPSHYLASPLVSNISEYFEKEYNINPENMFYYKDAYPCAEFETIILFSEGKREKCNTFDYILTTNRHYNIKNSKHLTNLFHSETFQELLLSNSIKIKKFDNVSLFI